MKIDINKMPIIGKGKISNIYEFEGYAYKQYPDYYQDEWVNYEVRIHNVIKEMTNLPVLSLELTDNTKIVKMPLIRGIELTDRIRKEKYKEGLEDLIELQIEVYKYKRLPIKSAHEVFPIIIKNSPLDKEIKELALSSLRQIEVKDHLCHFDFHFSNIMYDGSDYTIIDWSNAKLANPILDIARTFVILRQYAFRISGKYLKIITKKMQINLEDVYKAVPIIAALRMLEDDTDVFRSKLIDLIYEFS